METDFSDKNIEILEKERERYITKLFWFALEIALIFLIPAMTAVFLLLHFVNKKAAIISLPFTFVLSWLIVIVRWKKMNDHLTKLDKDISELKKQNQYDRNN